MTKAELRKMVEAEGVEWVIERYTNEPTRSFVKRSWRPRQRGVYGTSLCACYSCAGLRDVGAHTIMEPDNPRSTPTSCLAAAVLPFVWGSDEETS